MEKLKVDIDRQKDGTYSLYLIQDCEVIAVFRHVTEFKIQEVVKE